MYTHVLAYIRRLNKIQHAAVAYFFGFFKLFLCSSDFLLWNYMDKIPIRTVNVCTHNFECLIFIYVIY